LASVGGKTLVLRRLIAEVVVPLCLRVV